MMQNFQVPVIIQNRNQSYKKPNFFSLPHFKVSSETSETSSLHERRKTAEHAKLIVQQAEERTKRRLDLLERLFELEKQKF